MLVPNDGWEWFNPSLESVDDQASDGKVAFHSFAFLPLNCRLESKKKDL